MSKRPLAAGSLLLRMVLAGWMAILVADIGFGVWLMCRQPDLERLEAEGNRVIRQIERFREKAGRYPASLDAAGLQGSTTQWGPWKYRLDEENGRYELSVGEYTGLFPFILSWDTRRQTWYRDT